MRYRERNCGSALLVAGVLSLALSGCGPDPTAGADAAFSYPFLADRVEDALRQVEDAGEDLDAGRASDAAERLEDASVGLRSIIDYYIPLLEARVQVVRAIGLAGTAPALAAVDSARTILEGVAASHGEHLRREMDDPLARIEQARTELASGRADDARGVLGRLAQQLEVLYFRGSLVLEGSELDSPPPDPD